jgi:hypothetical protein
VGPVPEIVNFDLDKSGFGGLGDDPVLEGAGEEVGEDSKNVKMHAICRAMAFTGV